MSTHIYIYIYIYIYTHTYWSTTRRDSSGASARRAAALGQSTISFKTHIYYLSIYYYDYHYYS